MVEKGFTSAMKKYPFFLFLCLVAAFSAFDSQAKDLTLFEPGRGGGVSAPPPSKPAARVPAKKVGRPGAAVKQKNFILRGTSRLGHRYTAILENLNAREDIVVSWQPGFQITVPGGDGYRLVHVSARKAQLIYPLDSPCKESDKKNGVTCSQDGRMATLTLTRRNPTAPRKPPVAKKVALKKDGKAETVKKTGNPFIDAINKSRKNQPAPPPPSPELLKAREEARKKMAERYKDFKPKVIDPKDVPSGMKIVHTPFGDRLVPEK